MRALRLPSLLIVNEIEYLPVTPGGANLFFQLVNASYEKASMLLTSNKNFRDWGEVFGDPVARTAMLDHLHIVNIKANSHRLREYADTAMPTAQDPHSGGGRGGHARAGRSKPTQRTGFPGQVRLR